jgi:hypothetical protein
MLMGTEFFWGVTQRGGGVAVRRGGGDRGGAGARGGREG